MTIDRARTNPFLRYRALLDSYASAMRQGWSDADFVALVTRLDEAVRSVVGVGFEVSPLSASHSLGDELAIASETIWIKDDTGNVGGSHKSRHLFGVLLTLDVSHADTQSDLAIASCGNAAIAAAVIARARERSLRVFIPTWADDAVVAMLQRLDAEIEVCERRPGERGDPTYLRFLQAVDAGATPFSVQSTVTPSTLDGGRTLGWEVAEQLSDAGAGGRMRIMLQIGGGALATAASAGLQDGVSRGWVNLEPIFHPVQTEACAPFHRAWRSLVDEFGFGGVESDATVAEQISANSQRSGEIIAAANSNAGRYMRAWEPVGESAASGILDDETYDWLGVLEPMIDSGGWPVVVGEDAILAANSAARSNTGIDTSPTGSAGLAGLLDPGLRTSTDPALVLFTGVER